MVTSTIDRTATATTTERVLELYRRELPHWKPREMLEGLLDGCPSMLAGTVARCARDLDRPRCSRVAVTRMAEAAIREMVERGHAAEVEAFVEGLIVGRANWLGAWDQLSVDQRAIAVRLLGAVSKVGIGDTAEWGRLLALVGRDAEALAFVTSLVEFIATQKGRTLIRKGLARCGGSRRDRIAA